MQISLKYDKILDKYKVVIGKGKTMIYVISDIHGCYDEYMELLKKINLKDTDTLYVLGDVVDRGPHPIKVLQDMMMRVNVFPIVGNHDYIALLTLKRLCVEVTAQNAEEHLSEQDMEDYMMWLKDGGKSTIEEFLGLDEDERESILEYLEEFSVYEELEVNGKRFLLVHAGINNFEENKDITEYNLSDILFERADYSKRYYKDKYVVTGHTPTMIVRADQKPLVYEENGHIAIDCGCAYGGKLAAYCLDTGESVYVEGIKF